MRLSFLCAFVLVIAGCVERTQNQNDESIPLPALSEPIKQIDPGAPPTKTNAIAEEADVDREGSIEPITVLALVTPKAQTAFEAYYGSVDLALRSLQASANRALFHSGAKASIVITDFDYIDYDASGTASETIVTELENGTGPFRNVAQLRDEYRSDIVVLFAETLDYCGIASVTGAISETAFAVVAWYCSDMPQSALSDLHETITPVGAFAHEIGHLIGCDHEPAALSDSTFASNGHGYCTLDWQTLMATGSDSCHPDTIIEGFSNPNKVYANQATGTLTINNCAAVWRLRARTIDETPMTQPGFM